MVESEVILDEQMEAYASLVMRGSNNAFAGLSQMMGREVKADFFSVKQVAISEIPDIVGGRESLAVAVYLEVTGCARGHVFLIYQPQMALELVDLLLGDPPGTAQSLDEMEESALAEMGNIMASFFLNVLADATNLDLKPSPPAVMTDMAGAILDVALADIMQEGGETALAVEARFSTDSHDITGTFLVLPTPELLRALLNNRRES